MTAIEILSAASRSVPNEEYVQFMAAVDAVDELVEATAAFKGKRGAFMALGAQDARTLRLWAALARVGGAA